MEKILFDSFSEFQKKTPNLLPFVKLSNGWFCPVTKTALAKINKSMKREGQKFIGHFVLLNNDCIQVTLINQFK